MTAFGGVLVLAMVLYFLWPLRRRVRTLKMPGFFVEFDPVERQDKPKAERPSH